MKRNAQWSGSGACDKHTSPKWNEVVGSGLFDLQVALVALARIHASDDISTFGTLLSPINQILLTIDWKMIGLFSGRFSGRPHSRVGFCRRYLERAKHVDAKTSLWPPSCDKVTEEKLKYLVSACTPNSRLLSHSKSLFGSKKSDPLAYRWKKQLLEPPVSAEKVVRTFESLYDPNRAVPATLMNVVISAYGKLELGHRILDLVVEETRKGAFVPQVRHLTNLIGALGRSGDLEASLVLYDLMIPLEIDCVTLISIVDVLSRQRQPDLAFQLWKIWKTSTRFYPILNVYTTLSEAAIRARRFKLFQESELEARRAYHEAVDAKRLAKISDSQYTPKHCIHLSRLLHCYWFPRLRPIMPQTQKLNVESTLKTWIAIRPNLPGSPLSSREIIEWEKDVDSWISCNDLYAPSEDVTLDTRLSAVEMDQEDWLDPSDYADDAELDRIAQQHRGL